MYEFRVGTGILKEDKASINRNETFLSAGDKATKGL